MIGVRLFTWLPQLYLSNFWTKKLSAGPNPAAFENTMKVSFCLILFLFAGAALARTNLKALMQDTCENLGVTEGQECVKVQRKLESENAYLDQNSASICALVWKWGSNNSENLTTVGNLVNSCFKQLANLRINDEVRETCDKTMYIEQTSYASIETIQNEVKKMMSCLRQIGVPTRGRVSPLGLKN